METAYVTTKGQLVIPVRIHRKLGIKSGTKVCFVERDNEILFQPITKEYIRSVCGMLKSRTSVTKELLNERKKDKSGEWHDVPTWFRVTLWGKQAENGAKYLSKGRQVYIEGRLSQEEWQDREGATRYTLAVHATEMHFIGGTRGEDFGNDQEAPQFAGPANAGSSSSGSTGSAAAPAAADDDIPF